jgi:DNA-nicking Smr family endonuclease
MKRRPPTLAADPDWAAPAGDADGDGDAESRLWRRAMQGVTPLTPPPAKPAPIAAAKPAPRAKPAPAETPPPRPKPAPPPPPELAVGAIAGLDRRNAQRLKRGDYAIDARLDLHGHTETAAHRAVSAFVAASVAAERRCVLIVTGKGAGANAAPGETPRRGDRTDAPRRGVIRAGLPHWLGAPELRPHIVAVVPAHRRHGGDGAVYVLLKRRRATG